MFGLQAWGKRWSGNRWLAVACALLGLSLVSTVAAMAFWYFGVSLDDFETTDFNAVLSRRQLALAGALLVPGLSAAAAIRSTLITPAPRPGLSHQVLSCCWLQQCSGSALPRASRQLATRAEPPCVTAKPTFYRRRLSPPAKARANPASDAIPQRTYFVGPLPQTEANTA